MTKWISPSILVDTSGRREELYRELNEVLQAALKPFRLGRVTLELTQDFAGPDSVIIKAEALSKPLRMSIDPFTGFGYSDEWKREVYLHMADHYNRLYIEPEEHIILGIN